MLSKTEDGMQLMR